MESYLELFALLVDVTGQTLVDFHAIAIAECSRQYSVDFLRRTLAIFQCKISDPDV